MRVAVSRHTTLVLVALVALAAMGPASARARREIPAWLREHMDDHVAGTGTWITDNAAYRGPNEPYERYGQRWRSSPGRSSIVGELFGIVGTDTTVFWDFRVYWHPGRGEGVVAQYHVAGTLGEGVVRSLRAHEAESDQTFWAPDGRPTRTRHVLRFSERRLETASHDWIDGRWEPRRTYVWLREGP